MARPGFGSGSVPRSPSIVRLFSLLPLVLCSLGPEVTVAAPAGADDRVAGRFESTAGWGFELGSAFAFPGDALLGDEPAILLAMSNAVIFPEWLNAWKDKRWALDHRIADTGSENPTLIAYAGFDLEGGFQGISWYFGSGDGCGFCSSSAVTSTIRIADGRMVGKLEGSEDSYSLSVEVDIPVMPEAPGTRAANDAAPVAAMIAFRAALESGDPEVLRPLLASEWHDTLKDVPAEEMGGFYQSLRDERLPGELAPAEVWIDGDRALILFTAVSSYGSKLRGEAQMKREGESWKYFDAWYDVVYDG